MAKISQSLPSPKILHFLIKMIITNGVFSFMHVSGKKRRGQLKQKPYEGPKSNMTDACTSTADPVVEDDHIQVSVFNSADSSISQL
jgi:hypothetical protein